MKQYIISFACWISTYLSHYNQYDNLQGQVGVQFPTSTFDHGLSYIILILRNSSPMPYF